eukprot:TRINITY_DN27627_c0_g1_i1.p1 TRINITY_DN27627_c0_g1~~TRINITY_DN27627_c0_g1_i1.p1  ORF type:complete len:467 (+),score=93.17 TRINITY_DN27627_c0_g1_i1:50-1402(+)
MVRPQQATAYESQLLAEVRAQREVRVAITMPANPLPKPPSMSHHTAAVRKGRHHALPTSGGGTDQVLKRDAPVPLSAGALVASIGPVTLSSTQSGLTPLVATPPSAAPFRSGRPRYGVRVLKGDSAGRTMLPREKWLSMQPQPPAAASGDSVSGRRPPRPASGAPAASEIDVFEKQYRSSRLFTRVVDPIRTLGATKLGHYRTAFEFCDRSSLLAAVRVSRVWSFAVRSCAHLVERMAEFVWSGCGGSPSARRRVASKGKPGCYDGEGIVHYFGTGLGKHTWRNPSASLLHPIHVYSSANQPSLLKYLPAVVHRGPAHFETDALPNSWVSLDFGEFRVHPTWYTISTSTGTEGRPRRAHPQMWQLFGADQGRPEIWEVWDWTLLSEEKLPEGSGFGDGCTSMTFPIRGIPPTKHFRTATSQPVIPPCAVLPHRADGPQPALRPLLPSERL